MRSRSTVTPTGAIDDDVLFTSFYVMIDVHFVLSLFFTVDLLSYLKSLNVGP